MRTRTMIWLATMGALFGAIWLDNLAAAYVAVVGGFIVHLLHAIEFKLNRLLDHYNISVRDYEIAKD